MINQTTFSALNKSISFNGTNEFIALPEGVAEFETSLFSIELWFKTTDYNGILAAHDSSGDFWRIKLEGGKAQFEFDTAGGTLFSPAVSDDTFNDGEWHYLVAVRDDFRSGKLYVDGKQVGDVASFGGDNSINSGLAAVTIGKGTNGNFYQGAIDELRISPGIALSQEEIQARQFQSLNGDEQGLQAYYKFNDVDIAITDETANNNTGILNSERNFLPSVNEGFGSALSLNGIDEYVNAGDNDTLRVSSALTVEFWINPQQASGERIILNKEGEYEFAIFPDDSLRYAIANTSPGWVWIDTGYKVEFDKWTHLAITYDGSNIKTYASGVLENTRSGSGDIGDVEQDRNEVRIGDRQRQDLSANFKGQIDEVRIWNTARTQEEIQAILQTGKIWTFSKLI